MENLENSLNELSVLINDPETFIFEEASEAMRKIDLKRGEFIEHVDKSCLQSIDIIKAFKIKCENNLKTDIFIQLKRSKRASRLYSIPRYFLTRSLTNGVILITAEFYKTYSIIHFNGKQFLRRINDILFSNAENL